MPILCPFSNVTEVLKFVGSGWAAIHGWVAGWPDVVKGAAVGSVMTLLGVFLQNYREDRRHRQRLEYDSRQRAAERDQKLKQDVFVGIVDAAADLSQALGRLANAPLAQSSEALHSLRLGPFWKGFVVGNMETIEALQKIGQTFDGALIDLLEVRADVEALSHTHDNAMQHTSRLADESKRYELLLYESKKGLADAIATEQIFEKWQRTSELLNKAVQEQEQARNGLQSAQMRLLADLMDAALRYQRALVEATPALRKELGFVAGFDPEGYARMVIEPAEKMTRRLDEAIKRIQAKHGSSTDEQ